MFWVALMNLILDCFTFYFLLVVNYLELTVIFNCQNIDNKLDWHSLFFIASSCFICPFLLSACSLILSSGETVTICSNVIVFFFSIQSLTWSSFTMQHFWCFSGWNVSSVTYQVRPLTKPFYSNNINLLTFWFTFVQGDLATPWFFFLTF